MYMVVLGPHNKMWIIKIQNNSINSWKGHKHGNVTSEIYKIAA
jgi:hypothetical protein